MLPLILFTGLGAILFGLCLIALIWSVRSGQLDDLETPALRMLTDDDTLPPLEQNPHE